MARDRRPRDDEDEDDQLVLLRPAENGGGEDARPQKFEKKKSGSPTRLLVGLLGGGLAIIALVTLTIYVRGGTPKNVYLKARVNMQNERFDLLWDVLDTTSQEKMETWAVKYGSKSVDGSGKQAFINMMQPVNGRDGPTERTMTVVKEEIDGGRAVLTVEETNKSGRKSMSAIQMVKEDGRWKLDLAGMR